MTAKDVALRLGVTRTAARLRMAREGIRAVRVKRVDADGKPMQGRPCLEYDDTEVERLLARIATGLRADAARMIDPTP